MTRSRSATSAQWNRRHCPLILLLIACFLMAVPAHGADSEELDRLEKIIERQQAQIEEQQKALEELRKHVQELRMAEKKAPAEPSGEEPVTVSHGKPRNSLKLYGQVSKAVLFSHDGNDENTYLVDNDNTSTRVGLLGSLTPDVSYEIGTRIEVEYQTNPSNRVSQVDGRISDTDFEKRHLDLFLNSRRYGKLSLGWGSTASDGTAEVDLSGTNVVGSSDIGDLAGGQLFYDKNSGSLSLTSVGGVFNNMDGLGRDERIRYDSPSFCGFTGSLSYIADGGGDLALRYSAKIDGYKLTAAAAFSDPGDASDTVSDSLAGSISVLHDSGFNGTFALGRREYKTPGKEDGSFFYTKFGYRADWFQLGTTSLALEYGRHADIALDGDDADITGAQVVQDFRDWGTEAYLGWRLHRLDRNNADFDDINAVMTGMRVKF